MSLLVFEFKLRTLVLVENFGFAFENLGDHFLILLSLLVFEFKLRTFVLVENFSFTFENLGAHFLILE